MPKKIKPTTQFIGKDSTSVMEKPKRYSERTSLSKWYTSIHQLPLYKFEDLVVDDNIYSLVIKGNVPRETLEAAAENIRQEFATETGDLEYKIFLRMFIDIHIYRANIKMINSLVTIMRRVYVKQFADRLNSILCTNIVFDVTDSEDYDRQLNRCATMTGGIKLRLDLMEKNYEIMSKKYADKGAKPQRGYFTAMLIQLSDHCGYRLDDKITTFEYCKRLQAAKKKK